MQRITKDPDIRRQEIIDAAIHLFSEKGYEQTSMLDITKKVNVSQGLCYRYFKSKEEIYQAALENYVKHGVDVFLSLIGDDTQPFVSRLDKLQKMSGITQDDTYGKFVNRIENSRFHMQMQVALCEKLIPIVADIFQQAEQRGEINIENPLAAASFCMFGQLGIWLNTDISDNEKLNQTKLLIKKSLGI